jgi:hypothetical protein
MSQREAARHFNISRDSVAKIMAFSVPPGYRRKSAVKRPKLIIRHRIGPAGQCAMARESYVISARGMTRGAKPLA